MIELQSAWGWQPALYLFLGGMGAGAFLAAAILRFIDGARHAKTICISMWASAISLGLGLLCLLTELTAPLRGLMMWQSFSNFTSWMAIGAWLAFLAIVVFGLCALLTLSPLAKRLTPEGKADGRPAGVVVDVLSVVGALLALGVAAYTGILLSSAPGIPFWNSWLLPCLFTFSALDTGVALVEIIALTQSKREPLAGKAKHFLEGAVVVLVVLESLALAGFLFTTASGSGNAVADAAAYSAQLLISGDFAPVFWIAMVAAGLVLPLAASLWALFAGKGRKAAAAAADESATGALSDSPAGNGAGSAVVAVGAAGALVGGCVLRFLVVFAGAHGAVVGQTMGVIFAETLEKIMF